MPHPATSQAPQPGPSVGYPFVVLETIDSTNNYAMAQVHAGLASHGMAFFARHQTAGKGQRGNSWIDSAGDAIAVTVVLEPLFLPVSRQFELSMAIALASIDFLQKYIPGDLKIKWPNDLYWRDRKAGGILIENLLKGIEWRHSIAGIGINVNQKDFPAFLANPVSMLQITGKTFDAVLLAKELCEKIEIRWLQLQADPITIISDYNNLLYKRDQTAVLKKQGVVFETTIRSVTAQGELITSDVVDRAFQFGEIQWIAR